MGKEDEEKSGAVAEIPADAKLGFNMVKVVIRMFAVLLILSYCVYLYDKDEFKSKAEQFDALKTLDIIFEAIEKYSPFHEYLIDQHSELKGKMKSKPGNLKVFTPDDLEIFSGNDGGNIYLALMGEVFDVTKGRDHYGPGGGYSFFAGKDASRAFVTGQFDDQGLTDDVLGLELDNYHDLENWLKFYRKDYKPVGVLQGRYFDADGQPMEYHSQVKELIARSHTAREERRLEQGVFPNCNSEWSQQKGHRVWCTKQSGGTKRSWVGVPRRLFAPAGKGERCACVKDFGEPLGRAAAGQGSNNGGDLDHPNLKPYPNCDPKSFECQLSPPGKENLDLDDA